MITMSNELLTMEEAAKRLRVSKYTIQRWINIGKLEGVKIGAQWRVRSAAVDSYITRNIKPEDN